MITPTITQLTIEYLPSLHSLFAATGHDYEVGWEYNPDMTLLAIHEDKVVGFIAGWIDNQPYAWVDNILVHPKYRRTGVGYTLCVAMRGVLQAKGVKVVQAAIENPQLVDMLVRGAGFKVRGERTLLELHFIGGEDGIGT